MLWSFDELKGYALHATDGSLGSVHDLLFDDTHWTARWLVVDTAWLFGRRVLIAPQALGHPDAVAREFPVSLTKDQIKNAPDVDTDRPVNRQHEADLYGYYGYGPYWTTADNALLGGVAGVTLRSGTRSGYLARLPSSRARVTSTKAIRICAAPARSPATISAAPMIRSAASRTC
jgi:hypothetical protein